MAPSVCLEGVLQLLHLVSGSVLFFAMVANKDYRSEPGGCPEPSCRGIVVDIEVGGGPADTSPEVNWYGIVGGHRSRDLNENGRFRYYDPGRHYLDDVLAERAAGFVEGAGPDGPPFFM